MMEHDSEDEGDEKAPLVALFPKEAQSPSCVAPSHSQKKTYWKFHALMGALGLMLLFAALSALWPLLGHPSCDSIYLGYQCEASISHNWGQYSPFFSVPSKIPDVLPSACKITFAQTLSRHGARFPTSSKTVAYNATIRQLQQNVTSFAGKYAFLENYTYDLGADDLTVLGQQQMINAGIKFYERYGELSSQQTPFIRAGDQERVIVSAMNFSQGFHSSKSKDAGASKDPYPYTIVAISEEAGKNNTLSHDLCTSFETGYDSITGPSAQRKWAESFIPPILARLEKDLPGAVLSASQVIYLMDLCPFDTVASDGGKVSKFCRLFSKAEWEQYSYFQSLGKYYGYGNGNPLGPTQGVGFTNELIARMTYMPVQDETSVNHTLDDNPATFPIGPDHTLFADFSHDNDLTPIFAAMGLYNTTVPLSNTTLGSADQASGYSAAYTVPFAGRAYFEKMQCEGQEDELVRILVNDRVIPLQNCGADGLGRCTLSAWVESLSFARTGGHWDQCFV